MAAEKDPAEPKRVRVPNKERTLRMRRRIQKAAIDRFFERGFAGTTVDDIVADAGVTKGAFYHHFRSKGEVLAQIRADMLSEQLERFRNVVLSHDTDTGRLRGLVAAIIRAVVEDRATVTVWSREYSNLEPELQAPVLALREQLDAVIIRVIAHGMDSGEFKHAATPRELAFAIVGMCTWVPEWFSAGDDFSVEEVAEHYGDLVMNGLRTD